MNKIAKNILIGSIITIAGAVATQNVVAGLLYHEYKIKTYYEKDDKSRKNQDFMVLLHGIYGKSSDMESIAQKFKNDYRIINIQYPTTKETAEEIVERYIKPNIEDINGQIYADNLHRKIENQYYEIDENGKRKDKKNDENTQKNIKINFVAHSMGTGILRYYLKENPLENLGKVVFISPPSHGSQLSDNPISDILKDTLGNSVRQFKTSSDSFVNSLGEPDYECYVMIGNKSGNFLYSILIPGIDDGMVPFKTSRLNNCNYKVIENATHTSILKDKRTLNEITDYLKN